MNIIISGASKGLGCVLATYFSQSGNKVGLLARSSQELETICAKLNSTSMGSAFYSACDLTNASEVKASIESLANRMGGVEVLINNVGLVVREGIITITSEEWDISMATNVNAAFYCTHSTVPYFLRQGFGHIINISSLSTKIPLERGAAYTAGKNALNGFSNSLIHELHQHNIKVCTIFPGAFVSGENGAPSWKMDGSEICRTCDFVLNSSPNAFIQEVVVRPLNWPD
jgi:short-subunit dehydrogenase